MNKEEVVQNIKDNYKYLEKSIVNQLNLKVDNHYLTAGHNSEKIWLNLFRQIIPMKFAIKQGVFLIDSQGEVSKEVDIAVFDEQYTPYIFNYGNIHFIPIEAVAIVVQCKSKNISGKKNKENLTSWVDSIKKLKTSSNAIARMAMNIAISAPATQKETTPIKILCAHKKCADKDGEPMFGFDIAIFPESRRQTKKNDNQEKTSTLRVSYSKRIDNLYKAYYYFNQPQAVFKDFALYQKEKKEEIEIEKEIDKKKRLDADLKCFEELNKHSLEGYEVKDTPILSLIFQLNQLLMLINNPMLFPHQAYVDGFNEKNKV